MPKLSRGQRAGAVFALLVALASAVGLSLRARHGAEAAPASLFHVPRVDEEPNFDGELAEDMWRNHAHGAKGFLDERGRLAAPFSDVHLAWRGDKLLIGLYAADWNVRTTRSSSEPGSVDDADRFLIELRVGDRVYRTAIDPAGAVLEAPCDVGRTCVPAAEWVPRLVIGHDSDGTLNNEKDFDEEWMLEIGIPFSAIGLSSGPGSRFEARFARCDVPRNRVQVCSSFPGREQAIELVIDR